jgi:L,D-peptidoglycan transpeptidase YkuD (ErfK/YbiS/YcfS/YnhG family)
MERREATAMRRAESNLAIADRMLELSRYQDAAEHLARARADAVVVHQGWVGVHARFSDPALLKRWRGWAQLTIEESKRTGSPAILVDKLRRQVTLYRNGRLVLRFHAELGANGLRPKEHAGDHATPEGKYRVVEKKDVSSTRYYKALLINYPNDEDRMRFALGKQRGTIPQRAGIGNLIEIHGEGGQGRDWTAGCVALANNDMDSLWAAAGIGTAVTIVGTYAD